MSRSSEQRSCAGRRGASGFTLLEMMVSTVIMIIVLGGIAATFIATQRSYQHESQAKLTTESARQANGYLDGLLRLAGYGIDPRFAFDFATTGGLVKDNFTVPGFPADGRPPVVTDDLAFRYRNPAFLRRGSITGSTVTLTPAPGIPGTLGVPIKRDQPVLVACRGGAMNSYVVGRAAAATAATSNTLTLAEYGVPFNSVSTVASPPPCTTDTTNLSYVMLIHEVRIRIVRLGTGPGARPFLVAFNNHLLPDPDGGNTDFDPIAADVENFQVAYVMNRLATGGVAPDAGGNQNWIFGDAGDPVGTLPVAAAVRPTYETPYPDPLRQTGDPANIRQVRTTIISRSQRTPVRGATDRFVVENYDPTPVAFDGYYRSITLSAIRLPNMASRSFFTPPLRESATDERELNHSGG